MLLDYFDLFIYFLSNIVGTWFNQFVIICLFFWVFNGVLKYVK